MGPQQLQQHQVTPAFLHHHHTAWTTTHVQDLGNCPYISWPLFVAPDGLSAAPLAGSWQFHSLMLHTLTCVLFWSCCAEAWRNEEIP